jgi:WD40 repeat protein/transcriptional regulator with XRE-family HTH domain
MPISIPSSTLDKFTNFGDLLRFLRRRVSLTQMELANAVGYSHTQISRLEQNLRLPDIPTIESGFVYALGLEEEPKVVARLLELAANVRREDAPASGLCPYKGLNYYEEADADLFVGREALIARLVERVLSMTLRPAQGSASSGAATKERFLAVVGASGSGKSSLIRAGLVPALRWNKTSADWISYVLTPTEHPLKSLALALTQENGSSAAALAREMAHNSRGLQEFVSHKLGLKGNTLLLLVVDQFEELFAMCRSEEERASFIGNLLTVSTDADAPVMVLITLRADFYAHCANYPSLREALAKNQEYIGAMNDDELRRAIEEPARRGRWELEPGLVDLLLHDVGNEPGALPLLSHALLETWQRRHGRMMTLSGYTSSGGVRGAIAETAETVFTDQFTREQQSVARRIFLRLTELSDETSIADTRRRATFNELILKPEEADITHAVLNALADARLITTSEDAAEVAHEALIREWPTLRNWLEENRDGLRLHRQLTEAAQDWQKLNRSEDMLFRGARLAQARDWATTHASEMNELEHEFLDTSQAWTDHDTAERESQRQRELEAAKKLAETERRSAKQLRRRAIYLVGVLIFAILAALTAGIFASRNSTLAIQNASIAQTAQAASTQAVADYTRSEAQRLAAEARSLMQSAADPQLIALLSLRSINIQYTAEGDAALTGAAALPMPEKIFTDHGKGVYSADFSPDDKYVVTGSYDGIVRIFDAQTGQEMRQFKANETERGVKAIFSPNGQTIYAASNDGTVWGWEGKTGEVELHLSNDDAPIDIEISPDGRRLLIGSFAGTPRLLDAQTGATICEFFGHAAPVWELTFSPDSKYVATSSLDRTARLWKAENCELVRTFIGHADSVASVDFSPDGKYLATGSWDKTARLWDVETGQEIRQFIGHNCYLVRSVRFSPDGKYLLTGNCDKTARLWDVQTGLALYTFNGHTDQIWSVVFSDDGRYILTGSHDKTVWLWDLQNVYGEHPQFVGHTDSTWGVAISPDNRLLATGGAGRSTRLWDVQTGRELYTFDPLDVNSVVFSPDGKYLLTGAGDSSVSLWNVQTKEMVRSFIHDPDGHASVTGVAFSPDGKYALTSGQDAHARRWDIHTGKLLTIYGLGTDNPGGPDSLYGVAYSPDGQYVLTGGWDGVMRLHDTQSGKELRQFTENGMGSIYGVAFSPDGRLVLSGSKDNIARVWDAQTGQVIQRLAGHTAYLYAVAFSSDGTLVLTTSADNTARLWDSQTGKELRRFTGHKGPVEWAVFSPDGKTFVTASDDGTARMWSVDYLDTISHLCSHLLRDFTNAERMQYNIMDNTPTCPMP